MESNGAIKLVLASQSPRRIAMLRSLGLEFDTKPSEINEDTELKDPVQVVEHLAEAKARTVADQLTINESTNMLVLGADTIVVLGNEILGKPTNREHAYQMLMRMSGRHHRVYTGVSIIDVKSGQATTRHEMSSVFFRSLDPAEVRCYAKMEEPMDKAGAYALQGTAGAFVEKIEGCYSTIVGLPLPLTIKMLRAAGVKVLGMP